MLKIPSKRSLSLSIALSVMFFVGCIVCAFIMPCLTDMLIDARNVITLQKEISSADRIAVLSLAYAALAVTMLTDILLFKLLLRVRSELVFTSQSVALIRGVSWCLLLLGGVFCGLGVFFYLAFAVAFVIIFVGLCLRVVKNVLELATEIKSENDLTV